MQDAPESNGTHQDEQRGQEQQIPTDGDREWPHLTPTLHAGAVTLQQRTSEILEQMDELTTLGVKFIDELRQAFVDKMTEARRQIEGHETAKLEEWAMQSSATFDLRNRMQLATQMMGTLEASFSSH